MALPVNACSDGELEAYAPIHPEAAAELARRIAAGAPEREAMLREAEETARSLEAECDDLRDQRSEGRRQVSKCCKQLRELISEVGMPAHSRQRLNDVISTLEGAI